MVGNLSNRLMERTKNETDLKVGEGATIIMYSDRIACTITQIKSKCRAVIQRDKAICVGGAYSNEWRYERNNKGMEYEIYCRNGVWKVVGSKEKVLIGVRSEYYDYEF